MRSQSEIDNYIVNAKFYYCKKEQELAILRSHNSVVNEQQNVCEELSISSGIIKSIEQGGLSLEDKNTLIDKLIGLGYFNRSGSSPYWQNSYCGINYTKQ